MPRSVKPCRDHSLWACCVSCLYSTHSAVISIDGGFSARKRLLAKRSAPRAVAGSIRLEYWPQNAGRSPVPLGLLCSFQL